MTKNEGRKHLQKILGMIEENITKSIRNFFKLKKK